MDGAIEILKYDFMREELPTIVDLVEAPSGTTRIIGIDAAGDHIVIWPFSGDTQSQFILYDQARGAATRIDTELDVTSFQVMFSEG